MYILLFSAEHLVINPVIYLVLGRRFTLTPTVYKYLDVGIVDLSFVEIVIGDNQDNNIILPRTMWQAFIKRLANIERFVQSIDSSLSIQNLVTEIIKIRDVNMIKFTSRIFMLREISVYEVKRTLHVRTQTLHRECIL